MPPADGHLDLGGVLHVAAPSAMPLWLAWRRAVATNVLPDRGKPSTTSWVCLSIRWVEPIGVERRTMGRATGRRPIVDMLRCRSRRATSRPNWAGVGRVRRRRLRGAGPRGPDRQLAPPAALDDLVAGAHHRLDVDARVGGRCSTVTAPTTDWPGGMTSSRVPRSQLYSTSSGHLVEDVGDVGAVREARRSGTAPACDAPSARPGPRRRSCRRSPAGGAPSSPRRGASAPGPRPCEGRGDGPDRAPRRRRRSRRRCRGRRAAWPPGSGTP